MDAVVFCDLYDLLSRLDLRLGEGMRLKVMLEHGNATCSEGGMILEQKRTLDSAESSTFELIDARSSKLI